MDSIHLREIFPEEIWKIVTENLIKDSLADSENLANSSPFFRNLLAPQRSIFLFEKAFETLAPTVWKIDGIKVLPVKDILNCRIVCSQWSSGVDKFVSEKLQHNENVSFNYIWRLIRNSFHDRFNSYSVQKFIKHFEETHPADPSQALCRNPFVSTSLSVGITMGSHNFWFHRNEPSFVEGINKLILSYGVNIQYLTIDVQENLKFFDDVPRLQRWLSSMPELKNLSIYCDNWSNHSVVGYDENDLIFELKHLKCLDTCYLPSPIFNRLIRHNSHVSALIMKNCRNDYDFFTFPLPNLKKLEMEYCSTQISITLGFPEVQWPLESLSLVFGNDNIGCADILKVIQDQFANTLVFLELKLNAADNILEGQVWHDFKNCRLNLPKLKKIKVDVCANLTCLDFLLPMKDNLEEISITGYSEFTLPYPKRVAHGITVEFVGFESNMYNSNVWEIFPNLKKVEVTPRWDREYGARCWMYSREELVKGLN